MNYIKIILFKFIDNLIENKIHKYYQIILFCQ